MRLFNVAKVFSIDLNGDVPVEFTLSAYQDGSYAFYVVDEDVYFFSEGDPNKPMQTVAVQIVAEGSEINEGYEIDTLVPVFYTTKDLENPPQITTLEEDNQEEEQRVAWIAIAVRDVTPPSNPLLNWKPNS